MHTNAKAIARAQSHEDASHQLGGMMIVSLFPALFWTLSIAGIGAAVGHSPDAVALVVFGAAVAAFCASVFQALVSKR
ncbi:MAG: hypothetical protein ACK4TP_02670 [Hyphomicrobium sp.]|jgi:hypothetical protein